MRAHLSFVLVGVLLTRAAGAQCSPAVTKLANEQHYDDARADVQALLKKNANDDAALECMGYIYMAENKSSDAQPWFEKAVKANDKVSSHHLWLGNAIGDQAGHASKFKLPFLARQVKNEFDKAVQLDPTSIDARHGLIQFYSQAPGVMGGSMDKAKEQAREIAKLNAWRGHWEMGQLLERDKDVAGAEKEYLAAVAAAPDSTPPYNTLGGFYRRQKRWNESVSTYENLLKHRPDAVAAHLSIAYTLNAAGQAPDRVEHETRTWLAAAPADAPKGNFSVAHYLLGQVAEKAAKKDAAKSEYQQALSFNPNNNDAKKALDALK